MRKLSTILLCFILVTCFLSAQNPKREMRTAWIATVYHIDWPKKNAAAWNFSQGQKAELVELLDSLKAANMNAAFLQVRSFCDAMYNSKYEPWSSELTGQRGGKPDYDPLAFAIEEAHKRGMELHAWINPYRYAASVSTYGKGENDYATTHPEWLMQYGSVTILNPGLPEVRQRIAEVVGDIMEHYDVDGFLFDDYFYVNGKNDFHLDADLYNANNPEGLSQADWRRNQVNEMVRLVHDTIKAFKPWITFGIGPPPQVASSVEHAEQYGVPVGPYNDWQYNTNYSDPLAWLQAGTIDYIAPQMYWQIGSAKGNFAAFSSWWSEVTLKFGRHFYPSPSFVEQENGLMHSAQEMEAEIRRARADNMDGQTGQVFWSVYKGVHEPGMIRHLRSTVYSTPALPPWKAWEDTDEQLFVSNITYSSTYLSWTAPRENLRYAVYYVPKTKVTELGTFSKSDYFVGMTYDTRMKVPLKQGYEYAVAVLDRHGNEFPPLLRNASLTEQTIPQLELPLDQEAVILPTRLTWYKGEKAESYRIQVASDPAFEHLLAYQEVADTVFLTTRVPGLEAGKLVYWRVMARAANATDRWSEVRSFIPTAFNMRAPLNSATDVELTPLLECDPLEADKVTYCFEVATASSFAPPTIVFSQVVEQPSCRVAENCLASAAYYFARVRAKVGEHEIVSSIVAFKTLVLPVPQPVILSPLPNDTLYNTVVKISWQPQNAASFRVELSSSETFPPRTTKAGTANAFATSYRFENITPGLYFLRVRARSEDSWIDSPIQKLSIALADALAQPTAKVWQIEGHSVYSNLKVDYQMFDINGRLMLWGVLEEGVTELPLPAGTYLLQVGNEVRKIILD